MRIVTDVIGRSRDNRFFSASTFIDLSLIWFSSTGRNNANGVVFDLNMDYEQQTPALIHPENCVTSFVIGTRVDDAKKWVEEGLCSLFERDAVLSAVRASLLSIPDEANPVEFAPLILEQRMQSRLDVANTFPVRHNACGKRPEKAPVRPHCCHAAMRQLQRSSAI